MSPATQSTSLKHQVKRVNAVLAIVVTRRICSRLRLERFGITRSDYLVDTALHHLRIEIVDHLSRRPRIRQVLLAIHVSNKSSHTIPRDSPASFTYIWRSTAFRY